MNVVISNSVVVGLNLFTAVCPDILIYCHLVGVGECSTGADPTTLWSAAKVGGQRQKSTKKAGKSESVSP